MNKEINAMKIQMEFKAFADYIRGDRATNAYMTTGEKGELIPTSVADKIIDKVRQISPIYELAEKYYIKGNVSIPCIDEEGTTIHTDYFEEGSTAEFGKLKTIPLILKGFLADTAAILPKSLLNNSDDAVVEKVTDIMAAEYAAWIERECIKGTDDKIQGLRGVTKTVTTATANAITADDLIDLKNSVPQIYHTNAIWIMNSETRTALEKLKDENGRYLLKDNSASPSGYSLWNKPVYDSESMDIIGAGNTAIYFGDMSGLAIKIAEEMEINILTEEFATKHALGLLGFAEVDAAVQDLNKIAKLVCKGEEVSA